MSSSTVALFGANGQVGDAILRALLACDTRQFTIVAYIQPGTELNSGQTDSRILTRPFDLDELSREDLARELTDARVEIVLSALNGPALEAQPTIQDAAADAGVQRFYPSEYGFHHVYRKPGDPMGYVHPMWDMKARLNERAVLHPAILDGRMSYTVIGCGDFYNQERESVWCPWTQKGVDSYTLHIIGNASAKAQYTHLDDFAAYLVATLLEPEVAVNRYLNFPSDTISMDEIAALLEEYSGKPVRKQLISLETMHEVVADPSRAPAELQSASPFPVDFWFLVKGAQGQGRFRRPPGQNHNHLFPHIKPTTFETYFQERFQKA